jgi:long-chain fatty acid transport protein
MSRRLTLLVTAGLFSLPALATNGYFESGYGTEHKGLAGAGAALSLSSLSTATNPASAAFLGTEAELDLAYFNPNRSYTVSGNPSGYPGTFGLAPGTVTSNSTAFLVPSLGANWKLTPALAFNLTLYGNGGMNTNYHSPTFGSSPTGVNLNQLFLAPTLAYKVADGQALGLTLVLGYQKFSASGLGAFAPFSAAPSSLSNNGNATSTGYGLRVGYQGEVGAYLRVGASYQTRTKFGDLTKYQGLFAEQGGFDIPAAWNLGVALKATSTLTFALDVQQIDYSQIKSIGNPILPNLETSPLGSDGGAGFGWKNVTVVKLGAQWQASPLWVLRVGYSSANEPIPSSEVLFNILAPAVIKQHVSVGATRLVGKD